MHHFPKYFCYKMVQGGIWVWCIAGFVQWVYWLTKKFVFGWQIWILRHKKILDSEDFTIDMETLFLFAANKNAFFKNSGARLAQRAETGLFDAAIFTVSLSSIHCNHVGWPFSTKLRNVALILYTLYSRHFLINVSFCLNYARGWPRA